MKARTYHQTKLPFIAQLVLLECVGDMLLTCDQNIGETTSSNKVSCFEHGLLFGVGKIENLS